ncbi:MAG TPA: hypothetical protein VK395_18060 [Gemmataceae bacterium]|nr:hypothetical protein [Gemmataceae bacterium]
MEPYFGEEFAKRINLGGARLKELAEYCSAAEFKCFLLGLHAARLRLWEESGAHVPDVILKNERKLYDKAMNEAVKLLREEHR